jgi:hypothetical protein
MIILHDTMHYEGSIKTKYMILPTMTSLKDNSSGSSKNLYPNA